MIEFFLGIISGLSIAVIIDIRLCKTGLRKCLWHAREAQNSAPEATK